jgi:hypothetical protein
LRRIDVMNTSAIIGLFAAGLVFVGFISLVFMDIRRASLAHNLRRIQGFRPVQQLFSADGKTALAIDEASKQICLATKQRRGKPSIRVLPYAELLSSEILEDGASVMRSSRASQAGGVVVGALVGTVASGGCLPVGFLGALLGGLTGKKVSDDIVNRLDLALVLNDTAMPRFEVNLLHVTTKKSKVAYRVSLQKARHWHSVFDVIIKQAEAAVSPRTAVVPPPPERLYLYLGNEIKGPYSLAQVELLRDAGTVTPETPICHEGAHEWSSYEAIKPPGRS